METVLNITEICRGAEWHLATAIDAAMAAGLSREDAEAFVNFAFCEYAAANGGVADDGDDYITNAQWERLELGRPGDDWLVRMAAEAVTQ